MTRPSGYVVSVPQTGETMFYRDYKEPLTPLDNGFGYLGVVLRDADGRLLCAICGHAFENLGNHARLKHGVPARQYKQEFGLAQKSALISDRVRIAHVRNGLRRRALGQVPTNRSRPPQRRMAPSHSEETRNRRGNCFTQIVAVARSIVSQGHQPTQSRLRRHGIHRSSLEAVGLTLDRLCELAGAPPRAGRARSGRHLTDRELLLSLSTLAEKLGRTPAKSDLRRFGMPAYQTYLNHFGSFRRACITAGLAPDIPLARDGEMDLKVLAAFHVSGSMDAAARALRLSRHTVSAVLHRYGFPFPTSGWCSTELREAKRSWAADMAKRVSA